MNTEGYKLSGLRSRRLYVVAGVAVVLVAASVAYAAHRHTVTIHGNYSTISNSASELVRMSCSQFNGLTLAQQFQVSEKLYSTGWRGPDTYQSNALENVASNIKLGCRDAPSMKVGQQLTP